MSEQKDETDIYDDKMWAEARNMPLPLTDEEKFDEDGYPTKAKEGYSCDECGTTDQNGFELDEDKGEVVCLSCGYLVEENLIDLSAPTRRFSSEDPSVDNAHYGAPISDLYADRGLPTTFNPMEAKPADRRKSFVLKRINQQTVTNKERNLAVASLPKYPSAAGVRRDGNAPRHAIRGLTTRREANTVTRYMWKAKQIP